MPAWALSIPAPPRPFTVGFLDWRQPPGGGEGGEADDQRRERCALTFDNYGENCGMCRGDCGPLSKALEARDERRTILGDTPASAKRYLAIL